MSYTVAEAAKVATSQIGKRETGTNDTPYNRWLGTIPGYPHGGYGYPWCMSFQSWVASKAGGKANTHYPKTAGCAVAVSWFRNRGRWSSTPHTGDMVFYGPDGTTHVELVIAVSSSTITTIGGNTSGTLNGSYHEGNGVYQKTVPRSSSRIYGYGRPVYAAATQEDDMPLTNADVKKIVDAMKAEKINTREWTVGQCLQAAKENTDAMLPLIGKMAAQGGVDVDESAIVAGVLAGLSPAAIAQGVTEAMPPEFARQVVDEISTRLGG